MDRQTLMMSSRVHVNVHNNGAVSGRKFNKDHDLYDPLLKTTKTLCLSPKEGAHLKLMFV